MHQYQGYLGSRLWWVDCGQLPDANPNAVSCPSTKRHNEKIKLKSLWEITYELPSQTKQTQPFFFFLIRVDLGTEKQRQIKTPSPHITPSS